MAAEVGTQAPGFTLVSDEKKEVSLSDFSGRKVVLLFFPFAFTGVCTEELCTTRDNIALYDGVNAQVLGISIDSPFTLARFKEDLNLNFTLLSDFNKEVSAAYDSLYDVFPAFGLKGVAKRSVIVIDESNTIIHRQVCASPGDMPDFEAVKNALG